MSNCMMCNTPLSGAQRKWCSTKCKYKHSNTKHQDYASQKRRALRRRLALVQAAGGCCTICGYNTNLAALAFHHTNPIEKLFQLDARNCSNRTWESLQQEVNKCQLVCTNCHEEIHHPELHLDLLL